MTTQRKIIIGIVSVVGVILVASAVSAILLLNRGNQPQDNQGTQPGDTVALEQTPNYATCSILPKESIKDALGSSATSISDGEREGVIGRNYETAEACSYSFSTSSSSDNMLTIQTYLYSPSATVNEGNSYDGGSWTNITKQFNKEYILEYPAYFQVTSESGVKEFVLQVVTSAKNYRFAIEQPDNNTTYNDTEALAVLISLVNKADYSVTDTSDAPPAPQV